MMCSGSQQQFSSGEFRAGWLQVNRFYLLIIVSYVESFYFMTFKGFYETEYVHVFII